MDPEFLKALEAVAEYDQARNTPVAEPRLYYNADGSIIGLWNSDYPEGNYIVLNDTSMFHSTNTQLLRVANGDLKIVSDQTSHNKLVRGTQGQRVVKGHASLALTDAEEYQDVEYYDRKTNC